jgi:hypothetical protein
MVSDPSRERIPLTILEALGFLGGKEVKAEGIGNLGLLDRELSDNLESRTEADQREVQNTRRFAGSRSISARSVETQRKSLCEPTTSVANFAYLRPFADGVNQRVQSR